MNMTNTDIGKIVFRDDEIVFRDDRSRCLIVIVNSSDEIFCEMCLN